MKHYMVLVAQYRQETEYLREWIEYHHLIGVDHFYLVNDDDDPTAANAVLQPYVDKGIVTNYREFGYEGDSQHGHIKILHSYNNVVSRHTDDCKWMGFIDLDEFICPMYEDNIKDILKDYEDFGGLTLSWMVFGSSGLQTKQPLQIEAYTRCAEPSFKMNRYVKNIVQPNPAINGEYFSS